MIKIFFFECTVIIILTQNLRAFKDSNLSCCKYIEYLCLECILLLKILYLNAYLQHDNYFFSSQTVHKFSFEGVLNKVSKNFKCYYFKI